MRIKEFLLASSLLMAGGCVFWQEPYRPVQYYDLPLDVPAETVSGAGLTLSIENVSPVRSRMVYREKNNLIVIDEYNKWIQPPDFMLKRYLGSYFNTVNLMENQKLTLKIQQFDTDMETKQVTLEVNYQFAAGAGGTLTVRRPFAEENPEAFAAAFGECARDLAEQLTNMMQKK